MPIPFHDQESIEEFGLAAFLHLELADETLLGCLLFVNALGEPQEFIYNRLELLSDVLWRPDDRLPAARRRLVTTLFRAATLSPEFLLVRAAQVSPDLFGQDGQVILEIPVGRVEVNQENLQIESAEITTEIDTLNPDGEPCTAQILWTPHPPEVPLFPLLAERGLILEPFNRCAAGLREVYREMLGDI